MMELNSGLRRPRSYYDPGVTMDKVQVQDDVFTRDPHDFSEPVIKVQFAMPDLDFREADVPTPNEIPDTQKYQQEIPLELKRSATVEALIHQNDDLVARLKVTLRRLTLLENENDRLRKVQYVLDSQNTALNDQKRIWEEKDSSWRSRERKLEDIIHDFQTRLPEYEGLSEKVERFKKYQERIKTQVKPFIHQLKGYADSLTLEIQKLNAELSQRDAQIAALEQTQNELRNELDRVRTQAEGRQVMLVEHYERMSEQSVAEFRDLKVTISKLEERAQGYDETRAREDELANVIIALRRQKDDLYRDSQDKEQDLKADLGQTRSALAVLQENMNEVNRKMQTSQSERERLASANTQLEEQLSSLRYLWNSKADELEKLRANFSAQERLNAELSRQLSGLRRESEAE